MSVKRSNHRPNDPLGPWSGWHPTASCRECEDAAKRERSKARIQVRRGTYRGCDGWHILGKDSRGASVRIFSEHEPEARRMAGEIRAGRQPHFDQTIARSAAQVQCDGCIDADRVRTRECFCTPQQLERKRAELVAEVRAELLAEFEAKFAPELRAIADRLRETAQGLRKYGDGKSKGTEGAEQMKKKEINFEVTRDEQYLIDEIVARAVKLAGGPRKCNVLSLTMDITAVHCNGNPLRLEELLRADDFNLAHDVFGIQHHLDRSTGALTGHFSPRFTSVTPRAKVVRGGVRP